LLSHMLPMIQRRPDFHVGVWNIFRRGGKKITSKGTFVIRSNHTGMHSGIHTRICRFQVFSVSKFWVVKSFEDLRFQGSTFKVSGILNFKGSKFRGFQDSRFQGYKGSRFRSFRFLMFYSFVVLRDQGFEVSNN
jgi:hypothetical protein